MEGLLKVARTVGGGVAVVGLVAEFFIFDGRMLVVFTLSHC